MLFLPSMSDRTDFERLESVQKTFSKAVKDNYRAKHGGNAMAEFNRRLYMTEYLHIGAAKLRYDASANEDFATRARALMHYCDLTVPCLIRSFGEEAVRKAMAESLPPGLCPEEAAALSVRYGGNRTAALIRKIPA